jgi:site-specific recombinase XerC
VGEGKLPKFAFHRLRAVTATHLAQGGSDVLSIARNTGWANPEMAQRYIKLDTSDLKRSYDQAMQRKAEADKARPVVQSLEEFFASEPIAQSE